MREIKFRAYVKEKSLLAKVDQIFFDSKYVSVWDVKEQYMLRLDFFEVDLMQYIGLKDKAGLEVYEGDIVVFTYSTYSFKEVGLEISSVGKFLWSEYYASFYL